MPSFLATASLLATTLTSITAALPIDSSNGGPVTKTTQLAVYYGQGDSQPRLSEFCDDPNIDIIPIGFVNGWPSKPGNGGWPSANFGNQCGGAVSPGTEMFQTCSQLVEDVAYCQSKGKKILISIGGAADSTQVLANDQDGTEFADYMWNIFGPTPDGWTGPRPFGANVVDGFDFDVEANGNVGYGAMAQRLRANMLRDDPTTKYLLTAAPQCPTPDAQLGDAISKADFDYIFIQFYNTEWCSARAGLDHTYGSASQNGGNPTDISFNDWVSWVAANAQGSPSLFIGLAGSTAKVTDPAMYLSPSEVQTLLDTYYSQVEFGGIMIWEATAALDNNNYVDSIRSILNQCASGSCQPAATTTTTTTTTIATTTAIATTSATTTTAVTTTTVSTSESTSSAVTSSTSSSGAVSTTESSTTTTYNHPHPPFGSSTTSGLSSSSSSTQNRPTPPFGGSTTSDSSSASTSTTFSHPFGSSSSFEAGSTTMTRPGRPSSSTGSSSSSVEATTSTSSQEWAPWSSTSASSQSVDATSSSSTEQTWAPWSTTSSKPVDPTTSSSSDADQTWAQWSTTSSKPIHATSSSSSSTEQTWAPWSETSSKPIDPTSSSSSVIDQTWAPWSTTSSKPVRPTPSSSSSGEQTWAQWSETSSKPVDPTTSSSNEADSTWAQWSTTSSKPVRPTSASSSSTEQTWAPWSETSSKLVHATSSSSSSTEQTWAPWSTTSMSVDPVSSTTWGQWSATPADVYVTTTTTIYTDVCPTGFTQVTATITATITITDVVSQPTGKNAAWPTGPAGVPTGFYATTTVCSTGCAATPVTVTVTVPVPSGAITKTVVPTAATPVAEDGKPSLGAAASTPVQAASGVPNGAASSSWAAWSADATGTGVVASTPVQAASGTPTGAAASSWAAWSNGAVNSVAAASTPVQAASGVPTEAASSSWAVWSTVAVNTVAAASTPVQAASGVPSGAASGSGSGSASATGSPIGDYRSNSNVEGIKTYTGGAADQAPATAFSVAACVALALAGLIL